MIRAPKNTKMSKFLLKYFLISLLSFAPILVNAQVQRAKPIREQKAMKTDSSQLTPAKFDKGAISDYKEQKEFQYDEIEGRQLSLWEKFWMWFWNMIGKLFVGAASNTISKYFFIALGIALLAFLVVKMIGAKNIFAKKPLETILPYDVLNENIHEIDYDKELQRLVSDGKFRLAVRLLYLRALKKLSDAQIIQWQPDKTNYNYLTEINKPELKRDFSDLTLQFDYIWYGDFPIDANKFEPIKQSFNQFNSQIK